MDSVQTQIVFGLQIDSGLLSGLLVQLVLGLQLVWGGRVGGTEVPLSSDCRYSSYYSWDLLCKNP